MLVNEKNLYYIDNNHVNVFIIENDVENVINKILFVTSIFYNITNYFQ